MTCIVGVVAREGRDGQIYVGGDSAGVSNHDLVVRADQKVFVNGPYVMGFSGSYRMGQLLRYSFKPPRPMFRRLEKFMVTTFIDAVRECLKKGGYLHVKEGTEEAETASFVVGVMGRLFIIESDLQVAASHDGFVTVGSGSSVASGSLFSTEGKPPRERVLTALNAAERFTSSVRRPFVIVKG